MLKLIPKIIVLLCILVLVSPIEVYSSDVELATKKGKATTAKKTSTKAAVKCDFESIMGKKVTWKDKCNNKELMAACGEK